MERNLYEEKALLENHLRKLRSKLERQRASVAETEQVIRMYEKQMEGFSNASGKNEPRK